MTHDEQLDQLERSLQFFLKRHVPDRREARVTAAKVEAYVTALREYDAAKLAVVATPGNSKASQTLNQAKETLDQAREVLKTPK